MAVLPKMQKDEPQKVCECRPYNHRHDGSDGTVLVWSIHDNDWVTLDYWCWVNGWGTD